MGILDQLRPEDLETLKRYGFDPARFEELAQQVAQGQLSTKTNIVSGQLAAPDDDEWTDLPRKGSSEYAAAFEAGAAAIAAGEVGAIVLNGGMATRFGGVVKGSVDALPGRSFLQLKCQNFYELGKGKVPIYLMNSFATDAKTKEHIKERNGFGLPEGLLQHYTQGLSLRMTLDGKVFLDEDGRPSFHGPGHGDCTVFFRQSGLLKSFREQGGKYLFISNVDNLGARLDPLVLGAHILSGKEISAEVTPKWPGDQGGAPVWVDDEIWVVEGFRFPASFDQDSVPVFNTNTFTMNAEAIDQDFDLTICYVEKKVGEETVVQLEWLVGELTRFLSAQYLRVPRTGAKSRFFPIKTPKDLEEAQEDLQLLLG
ncbi:MAG: hypothetical protein CSA62_14735 [Planctomycetota bacterium]|nr:MAG: hypothetical protein CSA62_14735 [Planctomycetota bacterium]